LYIVGGYFADGSASNKLFVYDPVMDRWKELATMLAARGALTANFLDGTLYAVGGVPREFGSATRPLILNEAYDIRTDKWITKEPMPTPRQHLASVVFDDKLYVIGGRVNGLSSNLDANEVYDPAKDEWTVLAPMPSKRGGLAAAVSGTDGWIYVFGGEAADGTFKNNERYSTDGNVWESAPEMPNGRHGLAAVDIGSEIYVIGGGPQPGLSVGDFNQVLHTSYMLQ
jgi:N-acetylneuraminic acid mutarotase